MCNEGSFSCATIDVDAKSRCEVCKWLAYVCSVCCLMFLSLFDSASPFYHSLFICVHENQIEHKNTKLVNVSLFTGLWYIFLDLLYWMQHSNHEFNPGFPWAYWQEEADFLTNRQLQSLQPCRNQTDPLKTVIIEQTHIYIPTFSHKTLFGRFTVKHTLPWWCKKWISIVRLKTQS